MLHRNKIAWSIHLAVNPLLKDTVMFTTVDNISATSKANLDTFSGLSNKTYVGIEKLIELNVAAARALMSESLEHTQSLLAARDVQQLMALQSGLWVPMAEKAVSYSRHVYGILVEAGSEYTKVLEDKAVENQKAFSNAMDRLAKNAPAGAGSAIGVIKTAMASSQRAIESAQATARNALTMAENNVAAATEQALNAAAATEQALSAATEATA